MAPGCKWVGLTPRSTTYLAVSGVLFSLSSVGKDANVGAVPTGGPTFSDMSGILGHLRRANTYNSVFFSG